jgi:hypothetical protein
LILFLLQSTSARAWDPLQKARRAAEKAGEKLKQGDAKAAIENYARAQAYRPQDPDYRMGLGEALYADGDLKGAMSQFLAASTSEDPSQDQQALYNAGNVALAKKDPGQALSLYQKALLAGEPGPNLLHNLELAQRLLEKQKDQQQKSDQKQNQKQKGDQKQDKNQKNQDQGNQQDQKQNQKQDSQSGKDENSQQDQEQDQQGDSQQKQKSQEDQQKEGENQKQQEQQSARQDSTMQQPARPDSTQAAMSDSMTTKVGVMTPAEALRLLNALDHDEEELRRSIQRRLRKTENKSKHDW